MTETRALLSIDEVTEQLRTLGVQRGGVLLVHTSFRAVRPIEGGPLGLIEALRRALGPEGTLVTPSWTGDDATPFDPASTPAAEDLGVLPALFWQQPGVVRSDHPFAFAALGPKAREITQGPLPLPPHIHESPAGHVYDLDGQVLLLGVGHDANTTLHLAELIADVPYRVPKHITVRRDGKPVVVEYGENDHCCQQFALANQWLKGLQREGHVGHAPSKLMRSRDVVRVALEQLKRDPLVFLHPPEAGCEDCDVARSTV